MSSLLHSRKANVNDLKKGFVFFMDQEKAELRQIRNKMRAKKMQVQEVTPGKEEAKEWWDDSPDFHPISEWTLQVNEYYDIRKEAQQGPYSPRFVTDTAKEEAEEGLSEETEEEYEWYKAEEHESDCNFVFINKNRQSIEVGD